MIIDSANTIRIIQQEPDLVTKLLPYIGSLIGLIVGFLLGLLKDWIQINSTFSKTRKYFFHCLYTLKEGVCNQINNYKEYIQEFEQETNVIPMFRIDSGFNLTAISAIKTDDIYKIFITKGNHKDKYFVTDLSNLLNSFEIIRTNNVIVDKDTESIHKTYERCLGNFNEALLKFNDKIEAFQNQIKKPGIIESTKQLINEVTVIGNKFADTVKEPNISIYKYMNELILPLRDLFYSKGNNDYMAIFKDMELTFFELKASKQNFLEKVKQDLKHLEFINEHYKTILKKYNKYINPLIIIADKELFSE